jgi:hypothetical protein
MDITMWFRPLHVKHNHGSHVKNLGTILPHGIAPANFAKCANLPFLALRCFIATRVCPARRGLRDLSENAAWRELPAEFPAVAPAAGLPIGF